MHMPCDAATTRASAAGATIVSSFSKFSEIQFSSDPNTRAQRYSNWPLLGRLVRPGPLCNRPPVTPPPRAGLDLRPVGGPILPRLLPAVGSEIEQLQRRQHGLDAAPLRFIRLENLVAGPQVAAEIAAGSGRQHVAGVGGRIPRCRPAHEVAVGDNLAQRAAAEDGVVHVAL